MSVYADSSALVKLVADEPESRALRAYLSGREPVFSSLLAEVEVGRAGRRVGKADRAPDALAAVNLVELTGEILATAVRAEPQSLRTVDAIHLATALSLGDELDAFLAYDRRLLDAASAAGLQVATPT